MSHLSLRKALRDRRRERKCRSGLRNGQMKRERERESCFVCVLVMKNKAVEGLTPLAVSQVPLASLSLEPPQIEQLDKAASILPNPPPRPLSLLSSAVLLCLPCSHQHPLYVAKCTCTGALTWGLILHHVGSVESVSLGAEANDIYFRETASSVWFGVLLDKLLLFALLRSEKLLHRLIAVFEFCPFSSRDTFCFLSLSLLLTDGGRSDEDKGERREHGRVGEAEAPFELHVVH